MARVCLAECGPNATLFHNCHDHLRNVLPVTK
jgi:hypothetical protein